MHVSSIPAMIRNRINRDNIYNKAEYWNSKATELDGTAVSMWPNPNLNGHYHREVLDVLQRILPKVDGAQIIDVGCGTGRIARALAERGARVVGVDFSDKALGIARASSGSDNPVYRLQSMFDLADEACYDIAITWGSLTVACRERDELERVLRRIRGALRNGGRALFLEPLHRGPLHRVLNMDVGSFCEVAESAGFSIQEVSSMHFWPARVAVAYIPFPSWITTPVYVAGQTAMHWLRSQAWGDYKAVFAHAR